MKAWRHIAMVALFALVVAPGANAQAKRATASPALQKEFNTYIGKFRDALKANDSAAIAAMTKLPFHHDHAMLDAAQFRAKAYPHYFTARNRACIQRGRAVYDRDGDNSENYFIFCGSLIFVFTKTATGFVFNEIGEND